MAHWKCRNQASIFEPLHDKPQKIICAPSEDSDQPRHPPSLIRVFAVRIKKHWVLSYPLSALQRLWSDWADAQADLSLRWAQSHFVGFGIRRLICLFTFCLFFFSSSWSNELATACDCATPWSFNFFHWKQYTYKLGISWFVSRLLTKNWNRLLDFVWFCSDRPQSLFSCFMVL